MTAHRSPGKINPEILRHVTAVARKGATLAEKAALRQIAIARQFPFFIFLSLFKRTTGLRDRVLGMVRA